VFAPSRIDGPISVEGRWRSAPARADPEPEWSTELNAIALSLDPRPHWVLLDSTSPVRVWSTEAARELCRASPSAVPPTVEARLAVQLAALHPLASARVVAVYCPDIYAGPSAVISFTLSGEGDGDLFAVLANISVPGPVRASEQRELPTRMGRAICSRLRYQTPGREYAELVCWTWWLEELGRALMASVTLYDPAVADDVVSDADHYLVGVAVVEPAP
jgi:hypothetical protein